MPCVTATDGEEAATELELAAIFASEDTAEDAASDEDAATDEGVATSEEDATTDEETAFCETGLSSPDRTIFDDDSTAVAADIIPEDITSPSSEDEKSATDDELVISWFIEDIAPSSFEFDDESSPQPRKRKQAAATPLKPYLKNLIKKPLL